MLHESLTEHIIGCAIEVSNVLGCGSLEKVYENALAHELRKAGFHVEQQKAIPVFYDGVLVGDYVADLTVEGTVVIELKAAAALDKFHMAQCINYLGATSLPVCLLFNFGKSRLEFKRLIGEGAV